MHLAVDAVGMKHSGGAVVLQEFISAAHQSSVFRRISVFTSPKVRRDFLLPDHPSIGEIQMEKEDARVTARIGWYLGGLAKASEKIGADLLFAMSGMGTGGTVPHVTLIQQAIPFDPGIRQTLSSKDIIRFNIIRRLMRKSCRNSVATFVQSPTMRRWVSERFTLPDSEISIFPPVPRILPISETTLTDRMREVPEGSRILYVGSQSKHKNTEVAIHGTELLKRTLPDAILLATWKGERTSSLFPLGYLDPPSLRAAYIGSDLLIQPSLVESGPLAMGEAMQYGLPVLVADRPYAHDSCEDAALYFDPVSPEDLAKKAYQVLTNHELRTSLVAKGHALVSRQRQEAPYARMARMLYDLGVGHTQRRRTWQ